MEEAIRAFRLDRKDNVATVIQPVAAGSVVRWECGDQTGDVAAVTAVPRFHKVAISDLEKGARVIKYGQTIGVATCEIKAGSHVHTQNCIGTAVEELKA
jgi:altronate dehydratase